jgi:hypothetical protein
MAARRCAGCETDWPVEFHDCPLCMEEAPLVPNVKPIDDELAESLIAHKKFEDFLAGESDDDKFARREKYTAEQAVRAERLMALPSLDS